MNKKWIPRPYIAIGSRNGIGIDSLLWTPKKRSSIHSVRLARYSTNQQVLLLLLEYYIKTIICIDTSRIISRDTDVKT